MTSTGCDSNAAPSTFSQSETKRPSQALIFGALTLLYAVLIYQQVTRPLWFDELLTYYIARVPSLPQVFHLVARWDLNPPLLHLLAHFSLFLFGRNPITVRFPSVLEFYFASLLIFRYTGQKLGWPFAALPVLILWASPMFAYATEARPYALLFFWFSCLLVLWDRAIMASGRRWAIPVALTVANIGLLNSHVFAPLSLLPFLIAEFVRSRMRHKMDYPVLAALFLPLVLVSLYAPFYQSFRTILFFPPAFQASFRKIGSFYWNTFRTVSWALCAGALTAFLVAKGRFAWAVLALRPWDRALFFILVVNPVLLNLVLMSLHAPFWGRYSITSVVALYYLFALAVASAFGRAFWPGYAAVCATTVLLVALRIAFPAYRQFVHPLPGNAAALMQIRPDLPLVAASGLTFIEMAQYENPRLVSRLFYLRNRNAAIEYAHATMFEDLAEFQKEFALRGTVGSYQDFVRHHHEFLVLGTFDYPEDWLLRKLAADKASITFVGRYSIPYKDKAIFQVHLGEAKPPAKSGNPTRADSLRRQSKS